MFDGLAYFRPMRIGLAAALAAFALAGPASAQGVDPEAEKLLRSMTDYVSGLKSFSASFDVDDEIVSTAGQKLQYSASGTVAVERPGKLHMTRQGSFFDFDLVFDGRTISFHGKGFDVYGQVESPGPTIDDAVNEFRAATGLDAAGADLLIADPYSALMTDVESGMHVGTGIVGGVECEHLAFRGPTVDWQIWIQTGDKPLPMKYVITTKWVTGAPQYTIRLHDWNVAPTFDPKLFVFTPPAGAKKLDSLAPDQIGALSGEPVQ
jgi:hypothetical protein